MQVLTGRAKELVEHLSKKNHWWFNNNVAWAYSYCNTLLRFIDSIIPHHGKVPVDTFELFKAPHCTNVFEYSLFCLSLSRPMYCSAQVIQEIPSGFTPIEIIEIGAEVDAMQAVRKPNFQPERLIASLKPCWRKYHKSLAEKWGDFRTIAAIVGIAMVNQLEQASVAGIGLLSQKPLAFQKESTFKVGRRSFATATEAVLRASKDASDLVREARLNRAMALDSGEMIQQWRWAITYGLTDRLPVSSDANEESGLRTRIESERDALAVPIRTIPSEQNVQISTSPTKLEIADSNNEVRDKFIYDNYASMTLKQIRSRIDKRKTWESLTDDAGVTKAMKRYATRHGLPEIKKRRPSGQ